MNRYQRVRQIGEGAFGKAILVKKKDSARQFVIKEINITKMSPKEREESRKEVAVLAQLKHPNIVCYIESFEEKGSLYIVMNYCSGGDLYGRINERRGLLFSEDQILDWFAQLCLAIKHIHDRKILHRDIKSQNIFLTNTGTIQLGDFGIAKVLNTTAQLAHTCIGTPYYLSPEIVENMPYNNKSDVWSMGCVLYELTALKHAFEASNMKNLVLKIIRGSYLPLPPQYSYDLRGLIAQLFKRNPRDRPNVNSILKKNFIMQRVRKFLSDQDIQEEFSHTVMHGHKIAKALPPAPKPSADPSKKPTSTPRPGSANKKYDPAAVYGAPLNSSKNRMSGEKKRPATPGRQVPVPGQADWEKKRKERQELEEKRRAEMKKREQEIYERRQKELMEKQKVQRINKAREEGWKHLMDPNSVDENRAQTPKDNRPKSPRPLPVPKANPNDNRNRGNYEAYNQFLDKLYPDRPPAAVVRNMNHVDVVYMQAPRPLPAAQQQKQASPQFNMGPLGVPAAIDQAGRDRQLGAQAANRARVVEEFVQNRQLANYNKARAQHDLFGGYRPPSAQRYSPVPAPRRGPSPGPGRGNGGGRGGGGGVYGRDREEQAYLEKLRQIREQNFKDRRAVLGINMPPNAENNKESESSEERKKKVEALRLQAEHWAEMRNNDVSNRPDSASPSVNPPVPMTGALEAIGAIDPKQQSPQNGPREPVVPLTNALKAVGDAPESDRPQSAHQKKKDNILKRLNKKNPSRAKWNPPASPAVAEVAERKQWGSPASPAISQEELEAKRPQWGAGKDLHLSNVPLEMTASLMEATGAGDSVIKMNAIGERGQWGKRPDVMKALEQMPISQDTLTVNNSSQTPSPVPQGPPVGVGSTITISQKPPGPAIEGSTAEVKQTITKRPLPPPPLRSGTMVLSRGKADKNVPVVDEADSAKKVTKVEEDKSKLTFDELRNETKSVQMKMTSGNFDLKKEQFKLLRTISEPNLTSLFTVLDVPESPVGGTPAPLLQSTVRRHHSLDLTIVPENDNVDEVDQALLDEEEDDFAEEDIVLVNDDEDDDDSDMKRMLESMQTFIDDDDEIDNDCFEKTKVNVQEEGAAEPPKKSTLTNHTVAKGGEEDKAVDGDDEEDSNEDEEKNVKEMTIGEVLNLDDSEDDDDTFGDGMEDGKDYDRFGHLEQLRQELVDQLGADKLTEVYAMVQKSTEDDNSNIEDATKEAIRLLGPGPKGESLFTKIFQLVISDTAYTEDDQ